MNNNNTYNRYNAGVASESVKNIDEWEKAERSFYKNKHNSIGAQRIHIHPGRVIRIAQKVENGTYKPKPGYAFPRFTPSPREIIASLCEDRVVHHYVAPVMAIVADMVHHANGNVSHGNRLGYSAQTGAEQIREAISTTTNAWIVKIDISSFFPSIPREKAYEALEQYARTFYKGEDIEEKLAISKIIILDNPLEGCVMLGKVEDWKRIPDKKRLSFSKEGCGLPIGRFPSQIIASLYLAELDRRLKKYGICPRFVDDKCCVVSGRENALKCLQEARNAALSLGLMLHPDKVYIQPAHRGVNFCGRTIKGKRIYLSNRTLRHFKEKIQEAEVSEYGAIKMSKTANSYLGLMRHCTEWKNERLFAECILEKFGYWLYFEVRKGRLVCKVKRKFTEKYKYLFGIINIIHNIPISGKLSTPRTCSTIVV